MFFDTHAHLDDSRFDEDRSLLIPQIHAHGVDLIVNVGADLDSSAQAVALAHQYDYVYAAVGVHPHDAKTMSEQGLQRIAELSVDKKVVAIGEIGLDYYYNHSEPDLQRYWFARQLELAKELGLPVIIHDRDAHEDCLSILAKGNVGDCGGVMHCYSGSVEMARQVLDMGMYISIAGPVTYKSAVKTVEVVRQIPLERIFIETDCPYLTPVPHRGERNHSGHVRYVAEKIADIKGISVEEVAHITKENAIRFFGIKC